MVSMMVMRSFTNWLRSLSPLETTTFMPCAGGHVRQGGDHVIGLDAWHIQHGPTHAGAPDRWMGSIWLRKSSGMGERCGFVLRVNLVAEGRALGVKHADRIVGGVSRCAGCCIMLTMPRMAPGGLAGRVAAASARKSGMAWKARYK
jgi:hypothetical protein